MRGLPSFFYDGEGWDMNTREKILKAAREAFGERGYDGVSMEEIAKRAGVRKALIYYYFPSKEKLFEEVWMNAIEELENHIFKEAEKENKYMNKIKRLLKAYVDFVTNRKVISDIIEKEREHILEEERWSDLKERYESFITKMAGLIAEGKKFNAIYDDIDPVAAANLISSSISPRKKGFLENIVSMILRGIFKK